jgi:hypothetical protein
MKRFAFTLVVLPPQRAHDASHFLIIEFFDHPPELDWTARCFPPLTIRSEPA